MPPANLLARLRGRPFEPFRIVLSDGTTYDVRHPDLCMVGFGSAIVGIPAQAPGLYEGAHQIALRHIVRLEPLAQAAPAGNGEQG